MNDDSPVRSRISPLIGDMDPLEQVMREVEVDLEAMGWDQPPSFWLVMRSEGMGMCAFTLQMPPQVYYNPGIFFPPFVEHLKHSPHARAMVSHMHDLVAGAANVIGRHIELYAAGTFGEGTPTEEMMEVFRARMVHTHPDRIEQRTGSFVTVDSEHALITRDRGKTPEFVRTSTWGPEGPNGVTVTGTIPEALHDFLALLTMDMK